MTASGENQRLDELGRALVRAAAMTDAEVERVVSLLPYDRVHARIGAEHSRRSASATWLDILIIGRRTVPAMMTVALALAGWLWLGSRSTLPGPAVRDIHLEREWLTAGMMFSHDDMVALLIDGPVADAPSRGNQR